MTDIAALESWAEPLLSKLSSSSRLALANEIGKALRRSQQERIKAQRNPDGSAYAPRKVDALSGQVKRKAMFLKLRTTRYMKMRATANMVSVGYFDRVAKVARVHQEGLRDTTRPGGPLVRYTERRLLGFSESDLEFIKTLMLQHLSS